jgi:DNA-directed RNA polymerase specialized sigma24 family protein
MDDEIGFREHAAEALPEPSQVAYLLAGDHHAAEDLVQVPVR